MFVLRMVHLLVGLIILIVSARALIHRTAGASTEEQTSRLNGLIG